MEKIAIILIIAMQISLSFFVCATEAEENGLSSATKFSKATEPDGKNLTDTSSPSCQICNDSTMLSATSNETRGMMVGPPSIEKGKSVGVLNFSIRVPLGPLPIGAPGALDTQNAYRVAVGEPPLVWSATLASSAQTWAQHLADTNTFAHSCPGGGCGYGENLATGWPSGSVSDITLVNLWGNEKQYFKCGTFPDVSTTGNWADVGHYTQIIWPDTTQCGCGEAISSADHKILVCQYQPPGNFIGQYICPTPTPPAIWTSLGGYVTSSPSVIVDNLGKTEIWVKGGDNALWFNIDGTWHSAGGVLTSDPFAVKDYSGKIQVLVRGSDNGVWDFIYDPSTSAGHWINLGGYITEGLTAAIDPVNHNVLRVAARGGDNALWTSDLNINMETSAWTPQGGILTSRPYILFDPSGKEHILVLGGDNALWDKKGVWGGSSYTRTWNYLGGSLSNGPIATIEPGSDTYVAVFVKGDDNALWMCDVNSANAPETYTWYSFGGVLSSDSFAIADTTANKIHTFVRGSDSALWENIFSTSPWNPSGNQWQGLSGSILTFTPSAAIGSNTQAFVIGTDHALWRNTHTTFSAASSKANSTQQNDKPKQVNYPSGGPNSGGGKG